MNRTASQPDGILPPLTRGSAAKLRRSALLLAVATGLSLSLWALGFVCRTVLSTGVPEFFHLAYDWVPAIVIVLQATAIITLAKPEPDPVAADLPDRLLRTLMIVLGVYWGATALAMIADMARTPIPTLGGIALRWAIHAGSAVGMLALCLAAAKIADRFRDYSLANFARLGLIATAAFFLYRTLLRIDVDFLSNYSNDMTWMRMQFLLIMRQSSYTEPIYLVITLVLWIRFSRLVLPDDCAGDEDRALGDVER